MREWGQPLHDDHALYELFILETFQQGCRGRRYCTKRENFRRAYQGSFLSTSPHSIRQGRELMQDAGIIRNRRKDRGKHHKQPDLSRNCKGIRLVRPLYRGFTDGKSVRLRAAHDLAALR